MTEEKIIVGEGGKYPLNGILTLPDGEGRPVPAVIFVHGSGSTNMDDEKAKSIKVAGGTTAYYFKEMGVNNAPTYLKKTEKPILVIQGGKDVQVRAEVDFELYKDLLGERDNVAFKLYPDLNHLFMKSAYGTLKDVKKEYKIKGKVDETLIDDIAAWIRVNSISTSADI